MATSIPKLRVLDLPAGPIELDLASELFHRINRIIPEDQSLLTFPPGRLVKDAIAEMRQYGYSQVPVLGNGEVLGVFSFRSFAHGVANTPLEEWTKQRCAPCDLPVDEFLEQFKFARVSEEMRHFFDAMDEDNGVLIGTPERLLGVLTPMDFLRYLYRVASPFVMVSEIELALRALITIALSREQLETAARRCLSSIYGGPDKVPTSLEDMTFSNYEALISNGESWKDLEPIFGGTRVRATGKLKAIGEIRNALFHFKRELTMQDHQALTDHRDWLLSKIKQAEPRRRMEVAW